MQHNYTFKKEKKQSFIILDPAKKDEDCPNENKIKDDVSEKSIRLILSFSKNIDIYKSALLEKRIELAKS